MGMRRHAFCVILALKKDREAGMSLTDLMQKYSLSKTTVWHHVHNIILSPAQKQLLHSRRASGAKRSQMVWSTARVYSDSLLEGFDEKKVWPVLLAALLERRDQKKRFCLY